MTTLVTAPEDHARGYTPPSRHRRWEPIAATVLIVGTAVAYLLNLSSNGWANSFYSAAVQAGSQSWEAFFFGSSDAANSITVDKPPMSLWLMELSVRVFGLNSWAILVPQVLLGAASVALMWRTVRRQFGPAAGLLAGLVLAVTPVAALMFRFNNPDALLSFLMIAAVWAMLRAVEDGRTRWLVLVGVFVGFGFLTKQLQVMLVVPPIAATYLFAGPVSVRARIGQLFVSLGAMIVAAGWWIAIVELWPASSRPWIGGSQNNSILELTLGYNGLGRLNGEETGSVTPGGGTGGGSMWGETGITRVFDSSQGGQIAWLIPAALILGVAAIVLRGRAPRADARRAALVVWGLWLLVTGLTFSFMAGIFHSYYTVALAPAVAAVVGMGSVALWRAREQYWTRLVLAVAMAATVVTEWVLLSRSATFVPWLKVVVAVVGVFAIVALLIPRLTRGRLATVAVLAALFAGLAGPTAYAVDTIATAHQGSIVTAGPNSGGMGFGRGGGRDDGRGMRAGQAPGGQAPGGQAPAGQVPGAQAPTGAMPGGADGGGMGGLLSGSTPSAELTELLAEDADSYTWVAAAIGSNSASGYQLATQDPVMPIGGFNGSDPSPTLAQFQAYVQQGEIHWFIAGGGMGGRDSGTSAEISEWVTANFTAQTVDNVTLYDLTA
ncbi:glycosyl transferase [Rhodococcus sp. Leaf7]|uniref:ArnT family glycosyltransferase n=1 Tax=unclassified Rhodococcus (in: high G+C Gram-positive bacteria) TaxID=192944 RepID=UPI0006F9A141|nr:MULTISPECIES: glycosyltransferase family 39 protein [unclassified Rhodococcus (in: high G+C Gram-positive bacteria)]KQU06919.1 glycosyl transferase [Rhodococcus sp. Leaf7]KQU42438.1 glycosyl transferase [Rhodococcus sp. Leaf247]